MQNKTFCSYSQKKKNLKKRKRGEEDMTTLFYVMAYVRYIDFFTEASYAPLNQKDAQLVIRNLVLTNYSYLYYMVKLSLIHF